MAPTSSLSSSKILPLETLIQRVSATRNGKPIIHCHGVFDLLHVGHIKHLESAKKLGGTLVVTLTPDRFVNKGPGRPAFPEQLRAHALAALACVDYVAINDSPSAVQTIQRLKPNFFVKGSEFRKDNADHTGHIVIERQAVESVGGQLAFTDDEVFSSSNLINRYLSQLPEETTTYLRQFSQRHPIDSVLQYLNNASKLSVLVIGETIIDEYVYCRAIGKSSKEPVLVVKQQSSEQFAGGILAVANHVADFAGITSVVSVLGQNADKQSFIRDRLVKSVHAKLISRSTGPTIVKRRFIDGYFFQKLFEVYDCNDSPLDPECESSLYTCLENEIPLHDVVIVVDFGHGMLSPAVVDLITKKSRFLVVNAQSNAGNLGYHAISKYPRADLVCVAENEIRLEARDREGDLEALVKGVSSKLNCPNIIVTRGSHGCLCFNQTQGYSHVPAVAQTVKDRMGAGDTFISVAGLCVAQNAPMEVVGLLGNAAGAEAVATVGHSRYLQRVPLMKHVECLLK